MPLPGIEPSSQYPVALPTEICSRGYSIFNVDWVAGYTDSGYSLLFPIPSIKDAPNDKFNPNPFINFGGEICRKYIGLPYYALILSNRCKERNNDTHFILKDIATLISKYVQLMN
jgi:hypothetical protein